MKAVTFFVGIAAGMAVASAAMAAMYPDIPRRVTRDSRKMMRMGKRAVNKMFS